METTTDPELVREFMVLEGLRSPDDMSEIRPPEVRFFNRYYPRYLEKQRDEREDQERRERMWEEARKSREQSAHRRWLMADMRKWGPENGYFVGTRGRIPRKVIDAYREAKGL